MVCGAPLRIGGPEGAPQHQWGIARWAHPPSVIKREKVASHRSIAHSADHQYTGRFLCCRSRLLVADHD